MTKTIISLNFIASAIGATVLIVLGRPEGIGVALLAIVNLLLIIDLFKADKKKSKPIFIQVPDTHIGGDPVSTPNRIFTINWDDFKTSEWGRFFDET